MQQEERQDGEGYPDNGEKLVASGRRCKQSSSRYYFIGIAIGFIPLILDLISIGGSSSGNEGLTLYGLLLGMTLLLSMALYIALFLASIVCLCIKQVRFIGYGLLTMVVAIPVISHIANWIKA